MKLTTIPPTQKENREELLTLAVDLLGDVIALNCVLEQLGPDSPWDGPVGETLLNKLNDFIRHGSREIAQLSAWLTQSSQGSLVRDQPSTI